MVEFIYEIVISLMMITLSIIAIKSSIKLSDQKAMIDQLKREKGQLEKELNLTKSKDKRIQDEMITMKDKAQLEKIVKERIETRKGTTASVTPTSSTLASKKKHTGRSSFNVTTGSQSARSTSQPSSFDPILYSTVDTTSDDSHRHSHSSSHHHDSGSSSHSHSSSSHSSYDSGSSHSSHDSGSSSSFD